METIRKGVCVCVRFLDVLFFPFSARFTTLAVTLFATSCVQIGSHPPFTAVEVWVTLCFAFGDWYVLLLDSEGLWSKLVARLKNTSTLLVFCEELHSPN